MVGFAQKEKNWGGEGRAMCLDALLADDRARGLGGLVFFAWEGL